MTLFFEYPEHDIIGKSLLSSLQEYFPRDALIRKGKLTLANNMIIEISKIYALMGDFFAVVGSPIALDNNLEERKKRFVQVFELLNKCEPEKLKNIIAIGQIQEKAITVAHKENKDVKKSLEAVAAETNRLWNAAMGGGYWTYPLWPGEYLNITADNIDHFADCAKLAYEAGHESALDVVAEVAQAIKEGKDKTIVDSLIHRALAMEAAAGHYLTDSFSGGHIRVPRKELAALWTPGYLSGLLTYYMHKEEGEQGVWVTDKSGDNKTWQAFGDGSLLGEQGSKSDNANKVKQAARAGMLEIIAAIITAKNNGHDQKQQETVQKFPTKDEIYNRLPEAVESGPGPKRNKFPLFKIENDVLVCRSDVADSSCQTYTRYWTVVGTLLQFIYHFGLPNSKDNGKQLRYIVDLVVISTMVFMTVAFVVTLLVLFSPAGMATIFTAGGLIATQLGLAALSAVQWTIVFAAMAGGLAASVALIGGVVQHGVTIFSDKYLGCMPNSQARIMTMLGESPKMNVECSEAIEPMFDSIHRRDSNNSQEKVLETVGKDVYSTEDYSTQEQLGQKF